MGFNIGGIVVNRNYNNDEKELLSILNIDSNNFLGEKLLEEACSFNEYENCNITYKGDFTMILDWEIGFDENVLSKFFNYDIIVFVVSEVSESYLFQYFSKGKMIRYYTSAECEIEMNEGKKIDIEPKEEELGSDEIFEIIENFSGISLNGDDLFELKCKSYSK